jgi:energy-coupling factor transport system substrate-specific component
MSPESAAADLAKARVLALIPFGIALNIGLGTLTSTLKVPLYLDAIATIAVTLLAGFRAGAIVGVASFLIGGVLVNPVLPWFSGTQFLIAAYVAVVAKRGWLETNKRHGEQLYRGLKYLRVVVVGIGLGILAGIVSAPVIVVLFSGLTGSGPSLFVAFLLKSGETLYKAVLLSGVASEPLDKTIQLLLALALIHTLPPTLKQAFGGGYLKRNDLLQ